MNQESTQNNTEFTKPYKARLNKMGKITITLTDENEQKLREQNRRKGDMSDTINEALNKYFEERK